MKNENQKAEGIANQDRKTGLTTKTKSGCKRSYNRSEGGAYIYGASAKGQVHPRPQVPYTRQGPASSPWRRFFYSIARITDEDSEAQVM